MLALLLIASTELWDIKGGGTPDAKTRTLSVEIGFSGLPRVGAAYSLSSQVQVGASLAFDYAYYTPSAAFTPGIMFQLPVRVSLARGARWTLGLRFDPGVGVYFYRATFLGSNIGGDLFAITLGTSVNYLYHLVDVKIAFGVGLEMPIAIIVPISGASAALWWPLLFGPMFEYRVLDDLKLTLDTKFGPMIRTGSTVAFAMQAQVGVAYKF